MKIGIDLRCLNYAKYTGINAYCIHILGCLLDLKVKSPIKIDFVGIGLKRVRLLELNEEFEYIKNLFSSYRTLEDYYNSQLKNTKLLELISCGQIYLNNSLDFEDLESFDYLIQPQPRPIKLHPKTKLITFYHDLYHIIEGKLRLNKILNNKYNWSLIADRSHKIITNSRSTSIDLCKYLDVDEYKIKQIYPGTPDLDSFRKSKSLNKHRHSGLDPESPTTEVKHQKPNETYILAISGIELRKNWHNLLLAFKHLQLDTSFNQRLVLAGTIVDYQYYNYLLKLISKHNIKNVEWVIEPNEWDKEGLIEGCEFIVYPGFYEGFGFPILEAQKYKKCILTSKNSSLVEINQNNIFVNPNNYISIANGLLLIAEPEFVKSRIDYSWDELLIALEKMLIKCS